MNKLKLKLKFSLVFVACVFGVCCCSNRVFAMEGENHGNKGISGGVSFKPEEKNLLEYAVLHAFEILKKVFDIERCGDEMHRDIAECLLRYIGENKEENLLLDKVDRVYHGLDQEGRDFIDVISLIPKADKRHLKKAEILVSVEDKDGNEVLKESIAKIPVVKLEDVIKEMADFSSTYTPFIAFIKLVEKGSGYQELICKPEVLSGLRSIYLKGLKMMGFDRFVAHRYYISKDKEKYFGPSGKKIKFGYIFVS